MNRRTIDNIIVAVIGGIILLAAVVLFVAKADASQTGQGWIVGFGGEEATFYAIRDDGTYRNIPAPKFDKLRLDWRPKSAVLDDGNYEITYPDKIIHEGKELSGQVCREGKVIAISTSKNTTRALVQAEIITQIFKLTGEDSETMVRFVEKNRKLVDFLLELSVTEMQK